MATPDLTASRAESLSRLNGASTPTGEAKREADDTPRSARDIAEPTKPATPSAAALYRSGTLKWQQRPTSTGGSLRRPLSMAAAENVARSPRATQEATPVDDGILSRDQIAQSLAAKDPTWFKQTADRGAGSAAYRRNQDDNASETGSISGRRQLPGMSRESTVESEDATSPPPESARSSSPSRAGSVRGSAAWSNRMSNATSISGLSVRDSKPVFPLAESQELAAPSETDSLDAEDRMGAGRGMTMSRAQGRISPERPASPTKGMGGFVQSAMLKRSDSVNKRWSAQVPPGLSRQSSVASNKSGFGGLAGSSSMPKLEARPGIGSRGNSLEPSSRPSSSHSNTTITLDPDRSELSTTSSEGFTKPALPAHSRSRSIITADTDKSNDPATPTSPSKRWSPTKSSWLESAINKPDSPKPKMGPPPSQPSWMAELSKAKQQRASVDLGNGESFRPDPSNDSLRSLGAKGVAKPKIEAPSAMSKADAPQAQEKKQEKAPPPAATKPAPVAASTKPEIAEPKVAEPAPIEESQKEDSKGPSNATTIVENIVQPKEAPSVAKKVAPPVAAAKPETPPKKDFRSNLKPRQTSTDTNKKDEPEFKNVFGKLKKTQTQNYVAPDELKNNILRGKGGLVKTDGPQPSQRRDELKESLLAKKEEMKAKAADKPAPTPRKPSGEVANPTTPEALAKRKNLGKSESFKSPTPTVEEKAATPEALSRHKSIRSKDIPAANDLSLRPTKSAPMAAEPEPAATKLTPSVSSSKLAERFNPALAGILARGPSPMAGAAPKAASGGASQSIDDTAAASDKPAAELTHMTKGRARGPKRRAPGAKAESAASASPPAPVEKKIETVQPVQLVKPKDVLPSTPATQEQPIERSQAPSATPSEFKFPATRPKPVSIAEKVQPSPTSAPSSTASTDSKLKPSTPAKSPRLASGTLPSTATSNQQSPRSEQLPEIKRSVHKSSEEPIEVHKDPEPETPRPSVRSAAALWARQGASSTPSSPVKSPIKLPSRHDEDQAKENVRVGKPAASKSPEIKPKPTGTGFGLGIASLGSAIASRVSPSREPKSPSTPPATPPASSRELPPKPEKKPEIITKRHVSSASTTDASNVFGDFFDEQPALDGELEIDTQSLIASSPFDAGKIRTLRKQLQEISGDGKLTPVPLEEDRVLYEDSMYLCTHVFGSATGTKTTEVYLWTGLGVSESTLEDVQLFAKRAARDSSGKLVILKQGKETPNFFEALGGSVIIRRGSRYDSSRRSYMLCCRRHLDHMVFDEVDFALSSLCAGFSYIVSPSPRSPFILWKGRGSSAGDVGMARLIGMDLAAASGASEMIEEISQGSEPPSFLNIFPDTRKEVPRSADHWSKKAQNDRYKVRLFKVAQQQTVSAWPSFLSLRRPSWASFGSDKVAESNNSNNLSSSPTRPPSSQQRPQSSRSMSKDSLRPTTPNPGSATDASTKTKVSITEIAPFVQQDLEPENIYVLDAFFELYM